MNLLEPLPVKIEIFLEPDDKEDLTTTIKRTLHNTMDERKISFT